MARKRMIDPSLWFDEGMATLTHRQQLLYIGLISSADDEGRLKGEPAAIALMLPTVYSVTDHGALTEDLMSVLATMTKLREYSYNGRRYLVFTNYQQWQVINRPTPSKLPEPGTNDAPFTDDSVSDHGVITPNRIEKNRIEKNRPASRDAGFDTFWSEYPRKIAKQDALKAWRKLKPDLSTVLAALAIQKQSGEWQKDGGQFIPYPATWLNGRRWEDELSPVPLNGHSPSVSKSPPSDPAARLTWLKTINRRDYPEYLYDRGTERWKAEIAACEAALRGEA